MKRSWLVLLGGVLLAFVAYTCAHFVCGAGLRSENKNDPQALAWLREEYRLNETQFTRVRELHEAYQPKCMEMCRKIDQKNNQIQKLLTATNVITPEIKQVLAESEQLRFDCQVAMLQHFYEVANAMPPEQGKRYLLWVQQETLTRGPMIPMVPASVLSPRTP